MEPDDSYRSDTFYHNFLLALRLLQPWAMTSIVLVAYWIIFVRRRGDRVTSPTDGRRYLVTMTSTRLCHMDYSIACVWSFVVGFGLVFGFENPDKGGQMRNNFDNRQANGTIHCFDVGFSDISHLWRNSLYSAILPLFLRQFVLFFHVEDKFKSIVDGDNNADVTKHRHFALMIICSIAAMLGTIGCVFAARGLLTLQGSLVLRVCAKPMTVSYIVYVAMFLTATIYITCGVVIFSRRWFVDKIPVYNAEGAKMYDLYVEQKSNPNPMKRACDRVSAGHSHKLWESGKVREPLLASSPRGRHGTTRYHHHGRGCWFDVLYYLRYILLLNCCPMALYVGVILLLPQQHFTLCITILLYAVTCHGNSALFTLLWSVRQNYMEPLYSGLCGLLRG